MYHDRLKQVGKVPGNFTEGRVESLRCALARWQRSGPTPREFGQPPGKHSEHVLNGQTHAAEDY